MLAANKLALEKDLGVSMNELRRKEIEYLRSSFSILATASSVLVGFGYNNLSTSLEPQQQLAVDGTYSRLAVINWGHLSYNEILFLLANLYQLLWVSLSLSFNLICLFISMLSIVAGQAMALRGPEGSMDLAVRHMERQNRRALRKFGRGLFSFCLSFTGQAAMFFATLEPIKAAIMITVGVWTIHTLLRYGLDIQAAFSVGENTVVRATWSGDMAEIAQAMCVQSDRGGAAPSMLPESDQNEASTSVLPLHLRAPPPPPEGGRDLGSGVGGSGAALRPDPAAAVSTGAPTRTQPLGCWAHLGLLPLTPLWRMDKLLPFAYNNGPPVLEERNDARERYQQAVAIQIQHQQRLAPVTETQSSAHPSQSTSSAWGWVDHLRGQFHTPQSGKEPLLPM